MLALTDQQMQTVTTAAATVSVEKRAIFLERIAAMLKLRGHGHFSDADVVEVCGLAVCGLTHRRADSAA